MGPESFLAQYVTENFGPFGALGRFPLGAAGYALGIPGIGPNFTATKPDFNPSLLGGLAGFGLQKLFG